MDGTLIALGAAAAGLLLGYILRRLVLEGKGVLRSHQRVIVEGEGEGEITSGTFSPTLRYATRRGE